MSAGRRHLYISDDLWSRLLAEAGTAGVAARGRAYSASEYVVRLLEEKLGQDAGSGARAREETPRADDSAGAADRSQGRAARRADEEDVRPAFPQPDRPIIRPVTKSDQTKRGGK